jgi:hypothetical protein
MILSAGEARVFKEDRETTEDIGAREDIEATEHIEDMETIEDREDLADRKASEAREDKAAREASETAPDPLEVDEDPRPSSAMSESGSRYLPLLRHRVLCLSTFVTGTVTPE